MSITTIKEAAESIAKTALVAVELCGMGSGDALTFAAVKTLEGARDARTRSGVFAFETSSEQIAEWAFIGAVAGDIVDGNISRPSTGNVREYALAFVDASVSA